MKAYLLSKEIEYEFTEYEELINRSKEVSRNVFFERQKQLSDDTILKIKNNLKIDIATVSEDFFDILFREKNLSKNGTFYYQPGIFIGTKKISKEHKLTLSFLGLKIGEIQGKFPKQGIIIDKDGIQHRVEITKLDNEVNEIITGIHDFKNRKPKLLLNNHCVQCSFKDRCRIRAIREDNLSLLSRLSAKQIVRLEKKGIFTIKQLSYTFKPRRKNRRSTKLAVKYKPELQALALRTGKIYIQELPKIERSGIEVYLDIEGLPDDNFFYLFGILIIKDTVGTYKSFWSGSKAEEKKNWFELIQLLQRYEGVPIFHYGNYEVSAFDRLSKRYSVDIDAIRTRFVNVNTFIFGKIYFPTHTNGLKDLGSALGSKWSNESSSGLQSIVWRRYWEQGKNAYKNILLSYNKEDCLALKALVDELLRIKEHSSLSDNIEFVYKNKNRGSAENKKIRNQFDLVLKIAHSEYDKKKIKVDFERNELKKNDKEKVKNKKRSWRGTNIGKPTTTIEIPSDKNCFKHPERKLNKSNIQSKKIKIALIFTKNGVRKRIVEYIGEHGYCPICNNSYAAVFFRELGRGIYDHNFKAWVVFQRIEIQLSFRKINSSLYRMINHKIGSGAGVDFVRSFSEYYEETENRIIKKILESPFIHADETVVNILGKNQYIWVFTTDKYVTFKITETRDAINVKEFLNEYKGVLLSDFYSGYDAVDCEQQKCWVHLIRDLNNDLWRNPFDIEYENFVSEVRNLILPILESVYKFGLKKRFLAKYDKKVRQFYKKKIDGVIYESELCKVYQKRFKRYQKSLFLFINKNGINWHNNLAENAIRHICVQRKISGSFGNKQFPHYLRLVSLMKTCKMQNKSFFDFLMSKEIDIGNFKARKR